VSADTSYTHDPMADCIHDSVVYLCTSYGQLVECRGRRPISTVDLPFNDAVSVAEFESMSRTMLFIVQSHRNTAAVVDITRHEVRCRCCCH